MSRRPDSWAEEAALLRSLAPCHVLFLCVANSARSQMAEGIGRSLAGEGTRVSSAGSEPSRVRPEALRVLAEIGIDATDHRSKSLDEFIDQDVDCVITLCAEENCPVWLGDARRVHWALPDPAAATGSEEDILASFRRVRDELRRRLEAVFGDSGARNRSEPSEYRPDDPATARTAATTDPGQEERVQTIELSIEGMSCEHCVARVKKALEAVSGVSGAEVDLEPGSATVTGADIRLEDLVEAVDRAGYTASAA